MNNIYLPKGEPASHARKAPAADQPCWTTPPGAAITCRGSVSLQRVVQADFRGSGNGRGLQLARQGRRRGLTVAAFRACMGGHETHRSPQPA